MHSTRRSFLKTGTQLGVAGGLLGAFPRPLLAHVGPAADVVPPIEDPRVKALAEHAIDAARSAGAEYADVLLRHTRTRLINNSNTIDFEGMNIGIRVLVKGYWGYGASPVWQRDDIARLARAATQQASISARGKPRPTELAPVSVVKDQHWTTPVITDPFTVHSDEIEDFLSASYLYFQRRATAAGLALKGGGLSVLFRTQQNALATTDGTFCTQRLYRTGGECAGGFEGLNGAVSFTVHTMTPAGMGWEYIRDQPLRAEIDRIIAEAVQDMELPIKPVDVGRFDSVLDAFSLAKVVSPTVGVATELDRALGYEANAGGTSYLKDPLEMLGTFKVGSPVLTVTGNRTDPGAVATVQWDDEGVAPISFPLISKGVLANYSSTREGAGWLKDYTTQRGLPMHAPGCTTAGSDFFGGMYAPITQPPNLIVEPGSETVDFDEMIQGMSKGLAWKDMQFDMDFQQLNGLGTGKAYEIRNGKRVARVQGAGIMFQAPELYKTLTRLGGAASAKRFGFELVKGEPPQQVYHSVTAVPALFKDLTIFDVLRKA